MLVRSLNPQVRDHARWYGLGRLRPGVLVWWDVEKVREWRMVAGWDRVDAAFPLADRTFGDFESSSYGCFGGAPHGAASKRGYPGTSAARGVGRVEYREAPRVPRGGGPGSCIRRVPTG